MASIEVRTKLYAKVIHRPLVAEWTHPQYSIINHSLVPISLTTTVKLKAAVNTKNLMGCNTTAAYTIAQTMVKVAKHR